MIKEIDPKEPIQFAWNAFVDEMGDRKWGATDAFKWAWEEARKQEREACAKIADVQNMASKSTYKEQLETKNKPVGWIDNKGNMICVKTDESCRPLYTTPQPKQEQSEPNNSEYERGFIDGMQKQMQSSVDKAVRNMKNKLTQEWEVLQSIKRHTITTQDEPVAWGMEKDGLIYDVICPDEHEREEGSYTVPLYTHPKEWVWLTDKEVDECLQGLPTQTIDVYARRIETKIKEKNNG